MDLHYDKIHYNFICIINIILQFGTQFHKWPLVPCVNFRDESQNIDEDTTKRDFRLTPNTKGVHACGNDDHCTVSVSATEISAG